MRYAGSPADWARTPANKKLSKEVLATLEMVYQQNKFPSDEVLRSLWDLYRLPRRRLIDWFADRRRQDHG
jgi:Homeodomain